MSSPNGLEVGEGVGRGIESDVTLEDSRFRFIGDGPRPLIVKIRPLREKEMGVTVESSI